MATIEENATKVFKLLRKRQARSASELGQALGFSDGRGVSRPIKLLVEAGKAIKSPDGTGYLKAV